MRHRTLRTMLAMMALPALLLAACGAPEPAPDDPDDPAVDQPQPDETPEDPDPDGTAGDDERATLEDEVRLAERHAVQLAIEEYEVDLAAVTVVEAEAVVWSDGALGCPQEGEMYTQALEDGFRVVLDVDGVEAHYHAAEPDAPFRCDDPKEPAERR